ncbi:BREX-3 system P-loop-containing protein BrxF [Ensifer adhaerens]|uniref:BREX-3 system P-loop-containing protein BrxF n=1 Tax=Ensifer adhaerens TaxID=106592 RepID=UPI003CF11A83
MREPIQDKIRDAIKQSEGLYHRLVLLVGETGSGKTTAIRDAAHELDADVINVNLALSGKLLELTERQRALHLSKLLDEAVENDAPVALLDNTEILFDHDLRQDPLRLLQSMSRNRCVVASWNGTITNNKLTYAEAGHPEYRSYDLTETLVVDMKQSGATDPARGLRSA